MDEGCELQSAASLLGVGHEGDSTRLRPEGDSCQQGFEVEISPTLEEPPLFVEACCGCALLSACVSKLGFDTLPIDFHGNKHRPFLHVVELDLRKKIDLGFSGTFG